MKQSNSFIIYQWMSLSLNLSGNSLLAFALIFSFCTKGNGSFYSRRYLVDFLNISETGSKNILKSLAEKNILSVRKHPTRSSNQYFLTERILDIASEAGHVVNGCKYLAQDGSEKIYRTKCQNTDVNSQNVGLKSQKKGFKCQENDSNNKNIINDKKIDDIYGGFIIV